jgi:hypothetical protein
LWLLVNCIALLAAAMGGNDEYDIARPTLGLLPERGHGCNSNDIDPLPQSANATVNQAYLDNNYHDIGFVSKADDSCFLAG